MDQACLSGQGRRGQGNEGWARTQARQGFQSPHLPPFLLTTGTTVSIVLLHIEHGSGLLVDAWGQGLTDVSGLGSDLG